MDQAAREKGSALYEVHQSLLNQRERFAKNNSRLRDIANKLQDEQNENKGSVGPTPPLPDAAFPGIVKDLVEDVEAFRNLNNELENLLDKLSRIV